MTSVEEEPNGRSRERCDVPPQEARLAGPGQASARRALLRRRLVRGPGFRRAHQTPDRQPRGRAKHFEKRGVHRPHDASRRCGTRTASTEHQSRASPGNRSGCAELMKL